MSRIVRPALVATTLLLAAGASAAVDPAYYAFAPRMTSCLEDSAECADAPAAVEVESDESSTECSADKAFHIQLGDDTEQADVNVELPFVKLFTMTAREKDDYLRLSLLDAPLFTGWVRTTSATEHEEQLVDIPLFRVLGINVKGEESGRVSFLQAPFVSFFKTSFDGPDHSNTSWLDLTVVTLAQKARNEGQTAYEALELPLITTARVESGDKGKSVTFLDVPLLTVFEAHSSQEEGGFRLIDIPLMHLAKSERTGDATSWSVADLALVTALEREDDGFRKSFEILDLPLGSTLFRTESDRDGEYHDTQLLKLPILGSLFRSTKDETGSHLEFLYLLEFNSSVED